MNLPDWLKESVADAYRVEEFDDRFIEVPRIQSNAAYREMEDFVSTVQDAALSDELQDALDGRRPFRRFKDALGFYPDEEKRWFAFRDARLQMRVLEWLEDNDIELMAE